MKNLKLLAALLALAIGLAGCGSGSSGSSTPSSKPEKMLDKIAEGRINKFYEENCLMEQKYIRDPDKKIKDLVVENIAKIGENIKVGRFSRFIIEG